MLSDSRIRVLLMAGSMESGGSEQQTLLLLRHLDRHRFAPELYLTYRRGGWLSAVPDDVPIHAFEDAEPRLRLNWPGRIHHRLVHHLRTLIVERQIDVVYDRTYHMTLIAGPAVAGLSGKLGHAIARVSTIVSPPDRDLLRSESRFRGIKRRRLAAAYRRSRAVVAVSEAVRRSAIDFYRLAPEAVHTLRSPVDLARLRASASIDPGWSFEPAAIHLTCVGRMTREKGQDVLIDALARIPNPRWILWMVGDGPLRSELERQASERGVADRVRFTGPLESAAGVIARCDALICPSRYEGLPNVVLEAFGLRVPVIATATGGIGELVSEGETGRLAAPGDAEALARAIRGWIDEHETAEGRAREQSIVAAAALRVEREFNLETYLEHVERLL